MEKRVPTDAAGAFNIPAVAAGRYKVVVSSPGFETKEVAVTVGSEPVAALHVTLTVGAVMAQTTSSIKRPTISPPIPREGRMI